MAKELGAVVPDQFFQWMAGAALPSLVGLFLTPYLLYKVWTWGCYVEFKQNYA